VNINNNPKYVLRRSILAALVLAAVSVPFVHKDAPKYEEPKTNVAIETVSNTDVKETTNITLSRGGSGLEQAINKDILLLARLIESEAAGESYAGKLAVGTVVANRMINNNTELFGGPTLEGVVLKEGQFDGVNSHLFDKEPSTDSMKAARQVLVEGYRTYGPEVVYYYNPKTSTDKTFINSIKVVGKIGQHNFAINK
jgi:N-acetylmuramoyl-L-alanine amidase